MKDSHLLPKALYRLIKKSQGAGNQVVVITRQVATYSDRQVRDYLLCHDCEERFSVAETWALGHCYRGRGKYDLRDKLQAVAPIWPNERILVIPTLGVAGIEIDKLVYFAASVFWRASVHVWRFGGIQTTIDLGPRYSEAFRQYLLGDADFPNAAVLWISLCTADGPQLFSAFTPTLARKTECHQYEFAIPGLRFTLFVGADIPNAARQMCTYRSQGNFVYLTDLANESVYDAMARLIRLARPSERLRASL